jgi:hypothetical protein
MYLNLNGDENSFLKMRIPPECQDALTAKGIAIPDPAEVTFILREATGREAEIFDLEKNGWGMKDVSKWLHTLLMRRAVEGTDPAIVEELIKDMTPTTVASLIMAYVQGALPNPKELMGAIQGQMGTVFSLLLAQLAAGTRPASPIGTASLSENGET